MNGRLWLAVGALVAGSAVGFGALGAHGIKDKYPPDRVADWHTAAEYQMYHGLALLAVGLVSLHAARKGWDVAASFFVAGAILFSGSIYGITLSGASDIKTMPGGYALIAATPLGGICFLIGWGAFLVTAIRMRI